MQRERVTPLPSSTTRSRASQGLKEYPMEFTPVGDKLIPDLSLRDAVVSNGDPSRAAMPSSPCPSSHGATSKLRGTGQVLGGMQRGGDSFFEGDALGVESGLQGGLTGAHEVGGGGNRGPERCA